MYGIYQISSDTTLDKVAKEVGITKEELKKLNGLKEDVYLPIGSLLIVPKYNSDYEYYTVNKGDTIYSIAKKYGLKEEDLLLLNGKEKEDIIYPNENILVPKGFHIYVTEKEELSEIARKLNKKIEEIVLLNPNIWVDNNQIIKY